MDREQTLEALRRVREGALSPEEALSLLAKAKSIHDEMEAVCRPFISFEGVELLTQEYKKQLRKELLIN